MATHSGDVAVHATLTANTVDTVTLAGVTPVAPVEAVGSNLYVVKRTTGAEIYCTVSANGSTAPDPTVGGTDCYVLPDVLGALELTVNVRPVVVKLVSTGAISYTVEVA